MVIFERAVRIALPTQRTEAILDGMSQAFEFFGCVPKEVWWDNPKTMATAILKGRKRTINERYAALASHFAFEPLYCMPRSGNEKPVVEIRVKILERKWSPVPQMKDLDELNTYLRQRCVGELDRVSTRQSETIGVRFAAEKSLSATLPKRSFDACVRQEAKVDKYQFARFHDVSYSVPRGSAFQTVTVKGYVNRVEIVHRHAVVATHVRSYSKGDQQLDPLHYLATLERRPAALDHSNVYRNWSLSPVFLRLRERLEERHGSREGVRQYVRVLQLLASHRGEPSCELWSVRSAPAWVRFTSRSPDNNMQRRMICTSIMRTSQPSGSGLGPNARADKNTEPRATQPIRRRGGWWVRPAATFQGCEAGFDTSRRGVSRRLTKYSRRHRRAAVTSRSPLPRAFDRHDFLNH